MVVQRRVRVLHDGVAGLHALSCAPKGEERSMYKYVMIAKGQPTEGEGGIQNTKYRIQILMLIKRL